MTDAKVAEAARRWVLARERARKLRAKRGGINCTVERDGEPEPRSDGTFHMVGGVTPCWKAWFEEHGDDYEPFKVRGDGRPFCEACLEREIVHKDYRRATASRGAAERVLLRYAKAQVTP